MAKAKSGTIAQRLEDAAKAKQAMLEAFRNRPAADDPEVAARRAERLEIAQAREARVTARRLAREAEVARQRAEREAEIAQRRAEEEAREAERRANLRKRPGLASVLASHNAAKAARKDRH
ncbi:DUF6481 family protein [Teichococcus vastitatis]|uniref:DUF6481 family protein n=1 Tax=Teichococcus vastitatis TaxID=2307076 RepID=A0ABS9WAU7_9PROT|nr:DUF6481 family protein [Pseudoroseomonas vastitatis]MCI0756362.1 DUF6481 family protein [Pseudoroseomonas vastitatis]